MALKVRITLNHFFPEIWRMVIVPDTVTLRQLHYIIQGSMGWDDKHLYYFQHRGIRFEPSDPTIYDSEYFGEYEQRDDSFTLFNEIVKVGHSIEYLYDFGDNWQHTISLISTVTNDEIPDGFPLCIGGENLCPPEDIGGLEGFRRLLTEINEQKLHYSRLFGGYELPKFNTFQANRLLCAIWATKG